MSNAILKKMEFRSDSPMIERYPLDQVVEGYDQMHSGRVRFRGALTMA
jgi:D-arabinose 1-dehydrogenase-like Zn-dependent alcohol dehydrogenase